MAELEIQENVALAPHTTIGIGGRARYFAGVSRDEQLAGALEWARWRELPWFVLGGGSNVLFADVGFSGLVIHMRGDAIVIGPEDNGRVMATAAAGVEWDALVERCVRENLAGVECLSGIPGSVGATPIQNVGAYGQEVAETIARVEALDVVTGKSVRFAGEECRFGYRMSRFKAADRGRYIVTRVTFALERGGAPALRYAELANHMKESGIENASLQQVRDAVIAIRRRKAMVVDPAEVNSRSCGSFFTNPIVPAERYDSILRTARESGAIGETDEMPKFPAGDGYIKLSAAWLIEHSGFSRGMRHGTVGLSEKHVLAIVNFGEGRARDVLQLMKTIQVKVGEKFGVQLEPEPVIVGVGSARKRRSQK